MKYLTSAPITETSLGEIQIGMSLQEFIPKYTKFATFNVGNDLKAYSAGFDRFYYVFYGCVSFYFDLMTCTLDRIVLSEGFTGSFMGKIKIGSTVGELRALRPDISIDEEFAMIGSGWELSALTEECLATLKTDEEVDACKIIGFWISKPVYPQAAGQQPCSEMKKGKPYGLEFSE